MIVRNEGSLQAHWLYGCRSDPVAGTHTIRAQHEARNMLKLPTISKGAAFPLT
jgi:hypothetical protein